MRKEIGSWAKKAVAVLCALAMVVPAVPGGTVEAKADTTVTYDFEKYATGNGNDVLNPDGITSNYGGIVIEEETETGNKYLAANGRWNQWSGARLDISSLNLLPGDKLEYSFKFRTDSTLDAVDWDVNCVLVTNYTNAEGTAAEITTSFTGGRATSKDWITLTGTYTIPSSFDIDYDNWTDISTKLQIEESGHGNATWRDKTDENGNVVTDDDGNTVQEYGVWDGTDKEAYHVDDAVFTVIPDTSLDNSGWTVSAGNGDEVTLQPTDTHVAIDDERPTSGDARWTTSDNQNVNNRDDWFQVDMGEAQTFNKIELYSGADYARGYEVLVSDDAAAWTSVASNLDGASAVADGVQTITFSEQTARYIRIKQTGVETGYAWWSIYEVVVSLEKAEEEEPDVPVVDPTEKITNGHFEDGAAYWANGNIQASADEAHTGTYSGKVSGRGSDTEEAWWPWVRPSYVFSPNNDNVLVAGRTYVASAYFKSDLTCPYEHEGAPHGDATIYFNFEDGAGMSVASETRTVLTSTDWTQISSQITLPLGADMTKEMHLFFNNDWNDYEFYIDDASLKETASFIGRSLTLDGNIGVNFYMDIPESVGEVTAKVTYDGNTTDATLVKTDDAPAGYTGADCYKYTYEVAAKEMTKPVTVTLYDANGLELDTYTLDVEDYATTIITAEAGTFDDSLVTLAKAMLNYGEKAQTYFEYNLEAMAASGQYTEDVTVDAGYTAVDTEWTEGMPAVVYGSSLLAESVTTIRHYFVVDGDSTGYVMKYDSGEATLTQYGTSNVYYADVTGIAAKDLDKSYTVCLVDGEGNAVSNSRTYSVYSYAYAVLNGGTTNETVNMDNLAALVKAMVQYGEAANAYFPA